MYPAVIARLILFYPLLPHGTNTRIIYEEQRVAVFHVRQYLVLPATHTVNVLVQGHRHKSGDCPRRIRIHKRVRTQQGIVIRAMGIAVSSVALLVTTMRFLSFDSILPPYTCDRERRARRRRAYCSRRASVSTSEGIERETRR